MDELEKYVQVVELANSQVIKVLRVEWDGPHSPINSWEIYKELPLKTSEQEILRIVRKIANNTKYFGKCQECKQTLPVGLMFASSTCQTCASSIYGIVF